MKHVYFMKPVGAQGPIKIGCSKEPEKRLRSVEIWSPQLLELIAFVEGDHREESILHQMFGEQRLHGEWFDWSQELQAVLDYVTRSGKLPPLDYSLSPYVAGRKSTMTRRGSVKEREKKKSWTSAVNKAEQRVLSFHGIGKLRPIEIDEIMQRYRGFSEPGPTKREQKVLSDYIARLNALPAADRSLAKFHSWYDSVRVAQ